MFFKSMISATVLTFVSTASTHQISNSEATELATHRVEQLIELEKIEADFGLKFRGLSIANLDPKKQTDPYFRTVVTQYAGEDATKTKSIEFLQDHMGKEMKRTLMGSDPAKDAPIWPESSALELVEASMHFLEERAEDDKNLETYRDSLRTLTLDPAKDKDQKDVAAVIITTDDTKKFLKILVNLDGIVNSYEIIDTPREEMKPTFESIKRNLFEVRCLECHSGDGKAKRIPLDDYQKVMSSPRDLVIPGKPQESTLIRAVTRTDKKRMPPQGETLTEEQIKVLTEWIQNGAIEK